MFFLCFCFLRSPQLAVELDHLCGVENIYSVQGEWSDHVVFMVRHARGSYIVTPSLSLEEATPESNQFIRRCLPYARKPASQAVLSRMQLTLHATRRSLRGASHLVLAMSAWSVKNRCAPSRHCRDARVYGHTTTAMHDNEHCPPPGW